MGDRGVVFYRLNQAEFPPKQARGSLGQLALAIVGRPGDGSVVTYDMRFGIRLDEDGVHYWIGLNAMMWGELFEIILGRYGATFSRSDALPGGDRPALQLAIPRSDARLRPAPLTSEEVKASNVDEALDLLGTAWRRRGRRRRR